MTLFLEMRLFILVQNLFCGLIGVQNLFCGLIGVQNLFCTEN